MKKTLGLAWIAVLGLGLAFTEVNAAETEPAKSAQSAAVKPAADKPAPDATAKPVVKKEGMTAADSANLKRIKADMAARQEKRRKSENLRSEARAKEMRETVEMETMKTSKKSRAGKGAEKDKPEPAKKGAAPKGK